jgi:hypothetical protein
MKYIPSLQLLLTLIPLNQLKYLFKFTTVRVFVNKIEIFSFVFEESLNVFDNCLSIIRISSANDTEWFLSSKYSTKIPLIFFFFRFS